MPLDTDILRGIFLKLGGKIDTDIYEFSNFRASISPVGANTFNLSMDVNIQSAPVKKKWADIKKQTKNDNSFFLRLSDDDSSFDFFRVATTANVIQQNSVSETLAALHFAIEFKDAKANGSNSR